MRTGTGSGKEDQGEIDDRRGCLPDGRTDMTEE